MTHDQLVKFLGEVMLRFLFEYDNGEKERLLKQASQIQEAHKAGLLGDIEKPDEMPVVELAFIADKRLKDWGEL